ncbi:MAG: TonB family protein [Bryobacterales bacterium]|nr:TonB family protein [Bryobacterales bacterium]
MTVQLPTRVISELAGSPESADLRQSAGLQDLGGAILGRIDETKGIALLVEDCLSLPFFTGSEGHFAEDRNKDRFRDVLGTWAPGPDRRVFALGISRRVLGQLVPSAEDVALYSSQFSGAPAILLLISARDSHPREASLFVWRSNAFVTAGSRFPLDGTALLAFAGAKHTPPAPPAVAPSRPQAVWSNGAADVQQPVAAVHPAPAAPVVTRPVSERGVSIRRWIMPVVLGFLLVMVLALGGLVARLYWPASVETVQSGGQLDLRAMRYPGSIFLTWNRTAPILSSATGGRLVITDGEYQKELQLEKQELLSGSVSYVPAGNELHFRLDVFTSPDRTISESVRVIGGLFSELRRILPPIAAPPPRQEASRPPGSATVSTQEPRQFEGPPSLDSRPREVSQCTSDREVSNRTVSMPQPPALPQRIVPDPTAISSVQRPSVLPDFEANQSQPAPPPSERGAPVAQQRALPLQPPAATSGSPQPVKPVVSPPVPPVATRKVMPAIPGSVRYLAENAGEVEVRVQVDARGKVTNAALVRAEKSAGIFLSRYALAAAYQWEFKPATAGGKPVDGEVLIRFQFASR